MQTKSFSRFLIVIGVVVYAFLLATDKNVIASSMVTIVDGKQPKAIIVLPSSPTGKALHTAELLADYIRESTSVRVPVIPEGDLTEQDNRTRIWIGQSNYVSKQKIKFSKTSADGFVITFPDVRNIIIAGTSDWGAEFGACEFLERFLGVRWLLPGPFGEYVPKHDVIKFTPREINEAPAFLSRELDGLRGGEMQWKWARRNRMHAQIKFHHNLFNLFPVEKYKDTHPEFYPVWEGRRYIPSGGDGGWNPCFSAPGIIDEAILNICEFFEKNPEATSYSLGINDGRVMCQCDKCMARVGGKKNFIDRPDYSDIYYEWANKVAEGVLKKYPDKWFGCLAYHEVAEPPATFKVHSRIIPFITYDRMKWIDPVVEKQGKNLTERWVKQASQIGWYDYLYGTPYLVPRVYFHKMAEYYRYAQQVGVRDMYAEAYPNWGEGPKLYVALKLQWDPSVDVDMLLKDWYVAAVGSKAAGSLAQYYELWEDFWTNRVKSSKWFTPSGLILAFKKPDYLDLVTYEDVQKSRQLLENVVAKTETPEQRERANLILRAFEYYEASVFAYLGLVKNIRQPGKDRKYYEEYEKKRLLLVNEFEKDPVLIHSVRFDEKKYESLKFK